MNQGAANGIIGSDSYGTDLPETQMDETAVVEMQKAAKYSKTAEFKELKRHFESRIEFYQQYLPNGKPVLGEQNAAEVGAMWIAANCVIGELKAVLSTYEQAAELIKEENAVRRKTA